MEKSQHINAPMMSYWERESFFCAIDVAIIGSGIVGLNAAITLKEQHPALKIVLLERGVLPIGASTRNAGFACFGSMTELLDDLEQHGESEVLQLVEKRWKGLLRLRERVGDDNLQFERKGGFEIFKEAEENRYQTCMDRMDWMNKQLAPIIQTHDIFSKADHLISKFQFGKVQHMIRNQAEGQIDTGKMMRSLLKRAQSLAIDIFNGFEVESVKEHGTFVEIIAKNNWRIKSNKVLIANNGFAQQLCDLPDVQPARNQVLITKPIEQLPFTGTFHYDSGYFYFRNVGQRILLGGGRHLAKTAEQTNTFGTSTLIKTALQKLLKEVILPNQHTEIDMWWSGILGVGQQKKPIIKFISPNVLVAVRLGGMGVAIGSLIGEEAIEFLINEGL